MIFKQLTLFYNVSHAKLYPINIIIFVGTYNNNNIILFKVIIFQ